MKLDLRSANLIVGTVVLSSDARRLQATRTADGLALRLHAEVTFPFVEGGPSGYLTDLRVTLFHGNVEVGIGADPGFHWGQGERSFEVAVRLSAPVLAAIERARNGGRIAFRAHLDGKSGLVEHDGVTGRLTMPTVVSGDQELEFERDRWIDLLRATGWGENILIELALPPQPEPPWDEIWKAIRLAREALDRGGPPGWKACVAECRRALEKWRDLEQPDTGGTGPVTGFSRQQRFDVVRQSIHRYTHDAVHSDADQSTRAEAVMVLSAVAGLLGVRSSN